MPSIAVPDMVGSERILQTWPDGVLSRTSGGWPRRTKWWEVRMLWMLVVILLILWLMGWTVFHVAGGLIHLLLVVALIVIVYRLVTGRRV